jgi:DNA-binding GntR family transcriptional regulator
MGGRLRRSALAEPGRSESAMREHEDLIAAILDRDADRAEAQMRTHLRTARDIRIEMSIRESTVSG